MARFYKERAELNGPSDAPSMPVRRVCANAYNPTQGELRRSSDSAPNRVEQHAAGDINFYSYRCRPWLVSRVNGKLLNLGGMEVADHIVIVPFPPTDRRV